MCTQTPAARSIKPPRHQVGCLPRASRSMYFLGCTHRRPRLLRTLSFSKPTPFPAYACLQGQSWKCPLWGVACSSSYSSMACQFQTRKTERLDLQFVKEKNTFSLFKECVCVSSAVPHIGLDADGAYQGGMLGEVRNMEITFFPAPSIFEALVTSCPMAWPCDHLRAVWLFRLMLLRQLWR